MRQLLTLLLLGMTLKVSPQIVKAEYFFDNAAVAYGQGISLTVPSNTGSVQLTADLPVNSLTPGFHLVYFRVKDALKGWSPLTPISFLKPHADELITGFSYCIDALADPIAYTYKAFPSPSANVSMTLDIPFTGLPPGFHQIFFRARDIAGEWSPLAPKAFIIQSPLETISAFRYCIDGQEGSESWTYKAFPSPSVDVSLSMEIDLGSLPKGIHYLKAAARSANGTWSLISKGTFFNLYPEPLKITAFEYYFEDDKGAAGSLYTVNNFTPSANVTLDSLTFSIPVPVLENRKNYFIHLRAVDEAGNRSLYMADTIFYHAYLTGVKDMIYVTPKLLIYPNPASDMVNFRFIPLEGSDRFIIRTFDVTGGVVYESEFSFTEADHYTYNVSGLIPGVYRIVICTFAGKPVARATFVKK
jgi:hypothetical protein